MIDLSVLRRLHAMCMHACGLKYKDLPLIVSMVCTSYAEAKRVHNMHMC